VTAGRRNGKDYQPVKKKTSIGNGKHSRFKKLGSNGTVPKGYRKRYRGQGKG
jgi:hypothetical protein